MESIHKWIHENKVVNEKGEPLIFTEHLFMFEPYADFSRRQAYKACSQVGKSVKMVFKALHGMRENKWNIIYTLPSDGDVKEFVPTKVDKIIMANPELAEHLQNDNVFRKGVYDRFLYFKGTRSETAAIMTTADLLIHDEVDRSDQGVLEDYRSRIQRSTYGGIWEISNPSVKNTGIDISWNRSDRKEWAIRCTSCEEEQVMDWTRNIDYVNRQYVCAHCGAPIGNRQRILGRWIAANPDAEVSGYHLSQMMAPWRSASDLIAEESETDEEYFYNFILGEPIGGGDAEDFRQLIIDAWTPKSLNAGPYFLGVDIGSTKHYVLGNRQGIFEIGKIKTRMELEMLIEQYNPTVVMDAGPERTWAEEFRRKYPKLWINFYKRDRQHREMIKFGEDADAGIVWSDRSRVIDSVVTAIVYADIMFDLSSEDLEAYIKHWSTMVKKKEIDGLGLAKFSWDKNSEHAQDHWVHATVYYYIARSRGGPVNFVQSPDTPKVPLIQQTMEGAEMRDLKEYMEERAG